MAINFPKSPSIDQIYTYLTTTWKWNGSAWERSAATETGNTEVLLVVLLTMKEIVVLSRVR